MLIRDHLPAYITWERFEANQARLAANRNTAATPGAPRNGPSLLAGLVWCGRCGQRVVVRYDGRRGHVSYSCRRAAADSGEPLCQGLSCGSAPDALVAGQLLGAVEPAAPEASPAAVADVGREQAALTRQWDLQRERAAIEAGRAGRQYQACEPENRLVARELGRRWEDALKAGRRPDGEYQRWRRSAPGEPSDAAVPATRTLPADLPAVRGAATTTPADRQRAARLPLDRVVATADKSSERVEAALHWVGGVVRSHAPTRPVRRYDRHSGYPRLAERGRSLCGERLGSGAIARRLDAEGFRPPKRASAFTAEVVRRLTVRLGPGRRARHGSGAGLGPDECRPMELARRLGVGRDTVRGWVRSGWVNARRDEDGHHVIWADAEELRRLGELHALPRTWANRTRLTELRKPKPRPAR